MISDLLAHPNLKIGVNVDISKVPLDMWSLVRETLCNRGYRVAIRNAHYKSECYPIINISLSEEA